MKDNTAVAGSDLRDGGSIFIPQMWTYIRITKIIWR